MTPLSHHHRNVHHVAYYYYFYYRRVDPADAFLARRQYVATVVKLVGTALTFACPPAFRHPLALFESLSAPECADLLSFADYLDAPDLVLFASGLVTKHISTYEGNQQARASPRHRLPRSGMTRHLSTRRACECWLPCTLGAAHSGYGTRDCAVGGDNDGPQARACASHSTVLGDSLCTTRQAMSVPAQPS